VVPPVFQKLLWSPLHTPLEPPTREKFSGGAVESERVNKRAAWGCAEVEITATTGKAGKGEQVISSGAKSGKPEC